MKKRDFKVIVIFMSTFLSVIMLLFFIYPEQEISFSKDTEKTNKVLKTQTEGNVEEVEAAVSLVQNSLNLANATDDGSILKYKFANAKAFVLGDSVAEGLLDYRVLDENVCIGRRGARINTIDEDFELVKVKNPSIIFLEYGLNDLGYWRGDAQRFIEVYEEKITMIQKELPECKIYINCIIPIDPVAITNNPVYANYPQFNKQLEKMCKKKNCVFVDNSALLNQLEVKYEFDGIHPKYDYYYLWAANMARAAGL